MSGPVVSPEHYTSGPVETIEKIRIVVDGLQGIDAYCMGNIIKYVDRAGKKEDCASDDLGKAANYAHYLVYGRWKHERFMGRDSD